MHEANRRRWDAASADWARRADSRGLWRRCPSEPRLVLSERELSHLAGIAGRRACVLGSGDNQVAFALAGLGAEVTSVDISQSQLDIAQRRAEELGLTMSFLRADVTDLTVIEGKSFDLVYTGGHVAVWVSDLDAFYREAARILRPGGLFMVTEYHPFRRIWRESTDVLSVQRSYFSRGPFSYDAEPDMLARKEGTFVTYEFHWTVADYMGAVLRAGLRIVDVDEFGEAVADWEGAPMHGLPEFLLIVARRDAPAAP